MARKWSWIVGCCVLCIPLSIWPCEALEIFESVINARRLELIKMKAWHWDPFLRRLNASMHRKHNVNTKCRADMQRFVDAMILRQVPGLQLLDSQGSFPTGVLHGALAEIGSHKECFAAGIVHERGAVIARKFCSLYVFNADPLPIFPALSQNEQKNAKMFAFQQSALKIGACIPSSCSDDDFTIIINEALSEWKLSSFVSACDHNVPPDEPSIFVIFILAAFVTTVVLATVLDVINRHKLTLGDQAPADSDAGSRFLARLQTLSLLRTARSTFRMEGGGVGGKGERLDIFNGLRVIGLVWVIAIHTHIYMDEALMDNNDEVYELSRTLARQFIVNATMSVAIFTTVSGFMQWMTISKRSDEEHGKTSSVRNGTSQVPQVVPACVCDGMLPPLCAGFGVRSPLGHLRRTAQTGLSRPLAILHHGNAQPARFGKHMQSSALVYSIGLSSFHNHALLHTEIKKDWQQTAASRHHGAVDVVHLRPESYAGTYSRTFVLHSSGKTQLCRFRVLHAVHPHSELLRRNSRRLLLHETAFTETVQAESGLDVGGSGSRHRVFPVRYRPVDGTRAAIQGRHGSLCRHHSDALLRWSCLGHVRLPYR
ncbi:uncharacterized protein LOC119457073 isoform X2 [Dermacentor silvarum]|uniref:uncharacterized protein LOC119457073 isoform X2 n=1 Tax=Dermacentor silvarum TaxID=543639 RepID=UPI0021006F69|nr:uncharacterized protein LOC119457073 isoform X2 [Dermacentor silvarum]